ncbi:hypothetical protein Asi03nite_66820 [Actinoplanes siamensis]|uniref:Uncharacterized protein n=1 Tax=Actinoplanes siamensis TaxID=1223317 RepID=A0A919TNU3_9ACTN|nr:hypothetical protein Asi03nite_66820 [Actinoplanes siamensis]
MRSGCGADPGGVGPDRAGSGGAGPDGAGFGAAGPGRAGSGGADVRDAHRAVQTGAEGTSLSPEDCTDTVKQ